MLQYRCEIHQAIGGVGYQIVHILFLVNEAIVTPEAEVGSDIPGNL